MVDKYSLRHLMACILVQEELRVPSIRSGDPHFVDDLIRKQFIPMVKNTYIIVDLMFEIGDLEFEDLEVRKEREQRKEEMQKWLEETRKKKQNRICFLKIIQFLHKFLRFVRPFCTERHLKCRPTIS